jgi:hypothetical protein
MKSNRGKILGILVPLVCFGIMLVNASWHTAMWQDEYVFYRLASKLPNYSTTSEWFYRDRPTVLNPSSDWGLMSSQTFDKKQAFDWIYNNPIYFHSPLAPAITYPLVKLVNYLADKEIIPHIEEQPGYPPPSEGKAVLLNMKAETMTKILRIIPIILFLLSMYFAYLISYKHFGRAAYFFCIPLAACVQLLAGAYLFYWDAFMMFFFILALYLLENKHDRWALVVACLMVNTKMFIDLLFLIPLIVKNRKMVWAILAFIPYYLIVAINGGSIFYPLIHYFTGSGIGSHNYIYSLYNIVGWIYLLVVLGAPIFLLITVPLFWRVSKYPVYITLFICANLYAWGSGMGIAHLSSLLYVGVLLFPAVIYEFRLDRLVNKLVGKVIGNGSSGNLSQ